jgi:hypothetical protein
MGKDIHVRIVISHSRFTSDEVFLNVLDHPEQNLLIFML